MPDMFTVCRSFNNVGKVTFWNIGISVRCLIHYNAIPCFSERGKYLLKTNGVGKANMMVASSFHFPTIFNHTKIINCAFNLDNPVI